jgi:hypothetical protein
MKQLAVLFLLFLLPSTSYLQTTCATATNITAPGTFTSGVLSGTGASQPGASAARWYKFTPSTNGMLQINSCSGGADTRLWIWSGTCGNLQAVANNDDFAGCISTGASEYASRIQNLILLAGVSYYFEWDNYWENTSFSWSFSYSALPNNNDVGVLSALNPYSRIPISQAANGIQMGARLKNYSASALTSVALVVEVYELPNTSSPIATFTSNPQTLAVGAELDLIAGTWAPNLSVSKTYQIKYTKTQPTLDGVVSNDQQLQTLVLDYNTLARDNGIYNAAFNWSTTSDYVQATRFTLTGPDNFTGFRYYLQSPSTTQNYHIQLFNINGGVIDTSPFWESPSILATGAGWHTYNLPTALNLAAGSYLVGIYKSGSTPFPVGCATAQYRTGASYIKVGAGNWNAIEDYSLQYVFMLRPKFGPDPAVDIAIVNHQNPGGNYTVVSTRQHPNGTPLNFSLNAQNNGASTANNVSLQVTVKNAGQQIIYTATSAPISFGANQTLTMGVPAFTISQVGTYTIEYEVLCPGDAQTINNSVSTTFVRSTNQLAEHIGATGGVGIGNNISAAYDNGIVGQCFQLAYADVLDSVRFVLRPGTPANQPVRVEIYATNAQGLPIGSALAQSANFTTTALHNTNGVTLSLPFTTGALNLTPGTYFIGITEQAGNLQLGSSAFYYQPNNTYRRWNQNPFGATTWSPLEQFNQFVALAITPIFKPCLPLTLNAQIQQATCSQNNASIVFNPIGFSGQINFAWQPSALNVSTLNNLAPGNYSCLITDENNCQLSYNTTIVMSSTVPTLTLDSLQHIKCYGTATGALYWSASGGLAPYNYTCSNAAIQGASQTNLMAGTYQISLSDANSCSVQQTVQLTQPTPLLINTQELQPNLCHLDSVAVWQIQVTGGVAPYAVFWPGLLEDSLIQTGLPAGQYTVQVTDSNACLSTATISVTAPAPLQINLLAQTNSSCAGANNGAISVLAAGGTGSINYIWQGLGLSGNQQINLAPGPYTVIAQDQNACSISFNSTITEPQPLQLQLANAQNPSCFGYSNGTIAVNANGGTAPYAYQWLPVQSTQAVLQNLQAGSYTCVLHDANSCSTQLTTTLINPPALQVQQLATQSAFCGQANGGIQLQASGGTGPLQAVWSNNQTGLNLQNVAAGPYQVVLTDSLSCTLNQSFSIANVSGPQLTFLGQVAPSCHDATNGQLSVAVQDLAAIQSIVWLPSPSNGQGTLVAGGLQAGNYSCTVTDTNGCVASQTLTLVAPAPLQLGIQNLTNVSCNGGSNASVNLQATGGTTPYVFYWPTLMSTSPLVSGLAAGPQLCVLADQNGCTDSLVIQITEPLPLTVQVQTLQQPTCPYSMNGILQAQGYGGTLPYSYLWVNNQQTAPTLIGVGTNMQTVVLNDAQGCTDTLIFTPMSSSQIQSNPSITPVSCQGFSDGQIQLNLIGGQAPYLVSWNNGFSGPHIQNLSAGSYTAYLFDNLGCLDTVVVQVESLSNLTTAINGSAVICAGTNSGFISVDPQNGLVPYTLYMNGQAQSGMQITDLVAGSYQLIVSDNLSCTDTLYYQIDSSLLEVNATALPTLCQGVANGSVYLTAVNGIAPYYYSWPGFLENTDSLLGLSGGYVHYLVTDAMNCVVSDSIFVGNLQQLSLSATISPELFGQDGAIDLTTSGATAPYYFLWSNGLETEDINSLAPGWYSVSVVDQVGCTAIDSFYVDTELGISTTTLKDLQITPNPFTDQISINGYGISSVSIYDMQGHRLLQATLSSIEPVHQINLSTLPSGSYIIDCNQNGIAIKRHILRL